MTAFRPARELLTRIGEATYETLPTGFAQTFPCPVRLGSTTLRAVFYREGGPPDRRVVTPPEHVIELDGARCELLRFAPCTSAEVGATPPLRPVPGAGVDPSVPVMEFVRRRERVYDLAPAVWTAFSEGEGARIAPTAREFLPLLLSVTTASAAPFMVGATPAFFAWLRTVAAP
jgi:hypothetical protein